MKLATRVLALIFFLLSITIFTSAQEDLDNILKRYGGYSRRPGESIENWQQRVYEEIAAQINTARATQDGLNALASSFIKLLTKGKAEFMVPVTFEEAEPLVRELGLGESEESRLFAREALLAYLNSESVKTRAQILVLDDARFYENAGAAFFTDPEGIWSVFVWNRYPRGWVLTGLAGAERQEFLKAAAQVRDRMLKIEEKAFNIVKKALALDQLETLFSRSALNLRSAFENAWKRGDLKDAQIKEVRISQNHAEVEIKTSQGQIVLGITGTEKLFISYAYGNACFPLRIPHLPWPDLIHRRLVQADIQGAREALSSFANINPNSSDIYRISALIYLYEGNLDMALVASLRAFEVAPDDPATYAVIFHVLLARGETKDALNALAEARRRNLVLTLDGRAIVRAFIQTGMFSEAMEVLFELAERSDDPASDLRLLIEIAEAANIGYYQYLGYSRLRRIGAATPQELDRLDQISRDLSWNLATECIVLENPQEDARELMKLSAGETVIRLVTTGGWTFIVTRDDRIAGWVKTK